MGRVVRRLGWSVLAAGADGRLSLLGIRFGVWLGIVAGEVYCVWPVIAVWLT